MIHSFSRIQTHKLTRTGFFIALLLAFSFLPSLCAQDLDKPLQSIDEEITAFAFAPDGHIVYSVYRNLKTKLYDLEHDDIWLQDTSGKRRRLLEGQKFTRGNQPFSYLVDSLRWSPNGRFILAQLLTTTVVDDSGKAQDSVQTLLLDDNGHELRIAKGDNLISDAANATCLPDNATIVYLSEAVKPRLLFSLKFTRLSAGSFPSPQEGRTFRDVAWLPGTSFAVAVEQDHSQAGPLRLQRLDLLSDGDTELATLDGYEGGLSVSPSGTKVAYFLDKEIVEVRNLTTPNRVARLRIGLGVFRWSPDESRILLKRSIEKKSGDLVWIDLPPLAAPSTGHDIPVSQPQPVPILHGLSFRDFAISPDGRLLAVIITGKRNLLLFPLPSR
jgi:WD40 repeat protein